MPETVGLLTSAKIQKEDFIRFVRTLQIPEMKVIQPSGYYDVQYVRGEQSIWVSFDSEELGYFEEEEMKLIRQKLGDNPQTLMALDISKTEPTSQELAVEFIAHFAEQWPCVVDNNQADEDFKVYTLQEVFEIQKRGEKLWH